MPRTSAPEAPASLVAMTWPSISGVALTTPDAVTDSWQQIFAGLSYAEVRRGHFTVASDGGSWLLTGTEHVTVVGSAGRAGELLLAVRVYRREQADWPSTLPSLSVPPTPDRAPATAILARR